jgi:hypothetical protein
MLMLPVTVIKNGVMSKPAQALFSKQVGVARKGT